MNALIAVAEILWNHYRDTTTHIRSCLSDHMMEVETTPVKRYPGQARQYYGERQAHRAGLAAVVSHIVGTGRFADHEEAWRRIDRWAELDLPAREVAAELREAAGRQERTAA